ncbi:hypothetical protein [Aegicerativicinus sediminis]|uniref:hypothetical protein n=1 Tax=Aegicerativicinus sediminis TaxID=2893202 RepID=UPI001E4EB808|nr:hypothetical protein [Aegicerativicinus sediminis]
MKRIITTLIVLISLSFTAYSQNQKIKDAAKEKVEELNQEIIAGNKDLALSQDQKDKIYSLHIARIEEVRKARKNGSDKDELKVINKKYFQQIYNDVLSKEQKKARRAGKDDSED